MKKASGAWSGALLRPISLRTVPGWRWPISILKMRNIARVNNWCRRSSANVRRADLSDGPRANSTTPSSATLTPWLSILRWPRSIRMYPMDPAAVRRHFCTWPSRTFRRRALLRAGLQGTRLSPVTHPLTTPSSGKPLRLPANSERKPQNMLHIHVSECDLCGACIGVCPVDALHMTTRLHVDRHTCIDCEKCVRVCPFAALEVVQTSSQPSASRS
ncbi:MAG: hypothetical protein GF398_16240 [Chitinivibrionales bacterium]|nr:hypothetical protein [Chitinivibrionales bacterium]